VAAHHRIDPADLGGGHEESSQFDVDGRRDVPGGVLAVLADVEEPPVDAGRVDEPSALHLETGASPGGGSAGELANNLVVTDLMALADEFGTILVGTDYEEDRLVGIDQPPEPGGEVLAQRDGQGTGDVSGGPGLHRPGVDQGGSGLERLPEGCDVK
jgi:hypothetical protein